MPALALFGRGVAVVHLNEVDTKPLQDPHVDHEYGARKNKCSGQRGGKAETTLQQIRNEQEPRQRGEHMPECVVGVVGDFLISLPLNEQPNHRRSGQPRQRANNRARPVAALGDFGDDDDEAGRHKVLETHGHTLSVTQNLATGRVSCEAVHRAGAMFITLNPIQRLRATAAWDLSVEHLSRFIIWNGATRARQLFAATQQLP